MMFPVVFKKKGVQAPSSAVHYEIAANGIFQVRDTPIYRAVTRSGGPLPGLLPEEETLDIRFPPLPRGLVQQVLAFFREVYDRHGGEAIVILFYDPGSSRFRVKVPRQTLPGYRDRRGRWRAHLELRYGPVAGPPDFVRLGTIHSHAHLPAYSSQVDCDDESFEDGLHVVFGHMNRSTASASAAFVANGARFDLDPSDVVTDCTVPTRAPPAEWMARIQLEEGHSPALLPWPPAKTYASPHPPKRTGKESGREQRGKGG